MDLLDYLRPPKPWIVPVTILTLILMITAVYLFFTSRAVSYLSDDPETCINCHVMTPQYITWSHGSHREVAVCNDCHVPHNNVVNKYFFKAKDGLRHATVFTLRNEPQVIFIKEDGKNVVQNNCIRCHEYLITDDKLNAFNMETHHSRQQRICWDCHRETPHGRVNSLSSTPNARIPSDENPLPDWIKEQMKLEN
jgi:cytochrome c nitrite reductase small subunit